MNKIEFLKTIPVPSSRYKMFNGIFTVDGRLCVTEMHILFLTDRPSDFVDELPDGTDKVVEIYKPEINEFKKYRVQLIRDEFSKLPLIDEVHSIDCDECNGYGEVEYTYEAKNGRSYEVGADCPQCNGRGDFRKPTGNKIHDTSQTLFCVNHFNYDPKLFLKIIDVPNCPDVIELVAKDHKLYFRAGEFDGVLMAFMGDRDSIINLNHE